MAAAAIIIIVIGCMLAIAVCNECQKTIKTKTTTITHTHGHTHVHTHTTGTVIRPHVEREIRIRIW